MGAPLVPHVRNEGEACGRRWGRWSTSHGAQGRGSTSRTSSRSPTSARRAAARAARERLDLGRRDVRPYPTERAAPARRDPAGVGAGRRGIRDASRDRRELDEAPDRAGDRERRAWVGEHPRHARARTDRDRERRSSQRGGCRADTRAARGRSRRRPGDDRTRSHARVRARRDHGSPLRLRLRRPHVAKHRACSSSARTGSSVRARIRGSTDRTAVPGAVRAPGRAIGVEEAVRAPHGARGGSRVRLWDRGRIEPASGPTWWLLDPARYVDTAHLRRSVPCPGRRRRLLGRRVRARAGRYGADGTRRGGVVR